MSLVLSQMNLKVCALKERRTQSSFKVLALVS